MRIIDFHTHAFPDAVAERAIPLLEEEGNIRARLDGKVSSLLRSMDAAGIEISVLCSIATRPGQFHSILRWSREIASGRILPVPSVHPGDPDLPEKARVVHAEGFRGIKLHPYYQDFVLDEDRMFPLYEAMESLGLFLVCHTGFDLAFERVRRADPVRILRVLERFPRLVLVTTHFGAWEDWEEVRRHLLGKPIYVETSFSMPLLAAEQAREILLAHPQDRILFGTDSPWTDQGEELARIRALGVGEERERSLLSDNALRLLGLS